MEFLWVGLLGGLVGIGELISRYRDSPVETFKSLSAVLYVLLNTAAALLALLLVDAFGIDFGIDPQKSALLSWTRILAAGFGAMALLRSSFFNVRVGDKDVAVGGAALLQLLLDAADRGLDRGLATARARRVAAIMKGVSYPKAEKALPAFCLALMQNLSEDDQEGLSKDLSPLSTTEMDDEIRSLILGLTLMNRVGHGVLEAAVKSLDQRIRVST